MLTGMVKISPKAKRVTLQRYLISKLVYEVEKFELRDLCCLFENQLWLEQKILSDEDFYKKFGKNFEILSIILKQINFRIGLTEKAVRRLSRKLKEELQSLIFPRRNYSGIRSKYNGLFLLVESYQPGKQKKFLKPTARVGKGYRDKGSAKNPAKDGSPSWQEVSTSSGPIYHDGRLIENETSRTVKRIPGIEGLSFREYLKLHED